MSTWKILLTAGLRKIDSNSARQAQLDNRPTITADELLQVVGDKMHCCARPHQGTAAVFEAWKK